jgi:uncharacterized damage-inducible protein DinB
MRRVSMCFLGLTIILMARGSNAGAQDKSREEGAAAPATAATGPRAEFLEELAYYEQRYVRLAESVPTEKYAWRPAEGVRSIGEVYTHIVAANYGVARSLGTPPPAGFDFKSITAMSTDKAKTVTALKDSFRHFRQAIQALSDADADKPQKMFGRQTTLRGSFLLVTGHFGEHLGQSIAYARMNGIVPPWTEEQQQHEKPAEKPKS